MPKSLLVLVTGATGKQGGAVARILLNRGHRVRAFTRNPDTSPMQSLKRLGAEIAAGDFDDRPSIERAMRGADAVFAMGTPMNGVDAEIRNGKNLADSAKSCGVSHYLYSSVASANRETGIPHFESKAKVEQHIRSLALPFTIVGPVYFMENLLSPWVLPGVQKGKLSLPLPAECKLQQVCLEDIAGFCALAFESRNQFVGRRFDIASDELSGLRMVDILSRVTERNIVYDEIDIETARPELGDAMASMFDWLNHIGTDANIELLRRQFPEVGWHRFERWAGRQRWNDLLATPIAA